MTLRATLRQAVLLTAADNFAREVQVVPRAAAGDTGGWAPYRSPRPGWKLSTVDDVAHVLRRRLVEEARFEVAATDPGVLRAASLPC